MNSNFDRHSRENGPDFPPGERLDTQEKVGKIYDALRGDITGKPGIFEQLHRLDWRIKLVMGIALLALLLNNPLAMEAFKILTGKP